jgi:hypothetical protein
MRAALDALASEVRTNIENEAALDDSDFAGLLNLFAAQLATGQNHSEAWVTACRAHQRKGKPLATAQCPVTLGRVRVLSDHAEDIRKASAGKLTAASAEKLLRKNSDVANTQQLAIGFWSSLRKAVLGRYLIWATFDANNSASNPFTKLPLTRAGICAALGLPYAEPIIILVWDHHTAGAPLLHRPTIADAENGSLFRSHADPGLFCGWTQPLHHTPALSPQPEVVMAETASAGLKLPFQVIDV